MESCLYEGRVRHRRRGRVEHAFAFPLFMLYLDLDELDAVFRGRWLWSTRRPALAWFRRADHFGDPQRPLEACVRDLVEERTGRRPLGPIRMLAHLRYAGYVMNPLSVFYCFAPGGERVEAVVAEVTNTPWGERHCYVLEAEPAARGKRSIRLRTPKEFHVSPFMGMQFTYDWKLNEPGHHLCLSIANRERGDALVFGASLALERREIDGRSLASVLVRYPFMTVRVIAGIYWQALRLWLKGAPFHSHPRKRGAALEVTS